jgi:succinyl-diaminopimelate desuccinylase
MDVRVLAERLMTYDTSGPEGLRAAAAFVKGWLEARDIAVAEREFDGLPVVLARVGPEDGAGGPQVLFHGHLDVVPAREGQFSPRVEGDRLIGRGAYDMKGALAALMCTLADVKEQTAVGVRLVCVPDEESDDVTRRSTDALVREGLRADFALTGEPTDLHIGVQAKGVLAVRLRIAGTAAHGSTPWLGDNAILKAHDAYRRIETLPFSRESSDLFDRPSINLARIIGGDAFNKVPDACTIDVDIRFLPGQRPETILDQIRRIGDLEVVKTFIRAPAMVARDNPYVLALRDAVGRSTEGDALSVGRDGASDVIHFLEAGIPAVEFGPVGAGHHGPHEWVSVASLERYRLALAGFIRGLPRRLEAGAPSTPLRAVEGGLT